MRLYYKMYLTRMSAIISLAITHCFQTLGGQFRIRLKSMFNHRLKLDIKMDSFQVKIINQKLEKI